jgi:hypothetical protein
MFALLALFHPLSSWLAALLLPLVFGDIGQTAHNAYVYILGFLGSILALMLGYGGYLWMFNHDDASRVNRGKQLVIAACVGGMFVFLGASLSGDLLGKIFQ